MIEALVQRISKRVGRYLERQGWLVRDGEQSYLNMAEVGLYSYTLYTL